MHKHTHTHKHTLLLSAVKTNPLHESHFMRLINEKQQDEAPHPDGDRFSTDEKSIYYGRLVNTTECLDTENISHHATDTHVALRQLEVCHLDPQKSERLKHILNTLLHFCIIQVLYNVFSCLATCLVSQSSSASTGSGPDS